MDTDLLRKKIIGCWLGKSVGGTLGGPFEGLDGPFSLTFYDPVPTSMLPNDDLDLQVVWLERLLQSNGVLTARTLADAWLEQVHFYPDEYGVCINNLERGIYPPLSGCFDNPFRAGMGCAIRTEIWACLAPGNPDLAAALASEDSCVDHAGDGLYAARFFAALESLAFVCNDRDKLLNEALSRIPAECRVARAITDTCVWWAELGDWAAVRRRILDNYGVENWTDVAPNLAFTVLGWLAGNGDFGASICAAVNCGCDADCTGASLGALLGILDPDGIPEKWLEPIGRDVILSPSMCGCHPWHTIDELSDALLAVRARLRLPTSAHTPAMPAGTEDPTYGVLQAEPLRIALHYPEAGQAFVPGKPNACSLSFENLSIEPRTFCATAVVPPGWKLERDPNSQIFNGGLVLTPGQIVIEHLAVTPPETAVRPYRNLLTLHLCENGSRWSISAGMPLTLPWTINGKVVELPTRAIPLSDEPTRASIAFKVPFNLHCRIVFCAPARVQLSLDGKLCFDDVSKGCVCAVHRSTGSYVDADLKAGMHRLEVLIDPAPGQEARFCIGNPDSWKTCSDIEFAKAP